MKITSITKPDTISEEYLTFTDEDELHNIALIVDDPKVYIYISLIQTLVAIVDGTAGETLTRQIKIQNDEPIGYKLDDDVFLCAVIKQMLDGNCRVVGNNLHLEGGKYIIPNYKEKLKNDAFVQGVLTVEEADYDIYI